MKLIFRVRNKRERTQIWLYRVGLLGNYRQKQFFPGKCICISKPKLDGYVYEEYSLYILIYVFYIDIKKKVPKFTLHSRATECSINILNTFL